MQGYCRRLMKRDVFVRGNDMSVTSRTVHYKPDKDHGHGPPWQMATGRRLWLRISGPEWVRRLAVVVILMSGCVSWASAAGPAWNTDSRAMTGRPMMFQCPRAYLGVRQDLLPTHWEIVAGRAPLRLKASQVQRGELLCIYQDERGRSAGTVRRLAPGGYKCISDGVGRFRCHHAR